MFSGTEQFVSRSRIERTHIISAIHIIGIETRQREMSSDSDDDEYPEELFNWQELPRSLPLGLDNDENPKEIGASWHQWCCQYPDGHHEEISRFTHLELLLLPPLVPNPPPSPQNNNIKTLGPVARFPKALSRRLILKSGTISYEQ
jgi:hypothetical protein